MFSFFYPTFYFERAVDISPDLLRSFGISAILTDLDDTLTTHGCQQLAPEYALWLQTLRDAGISVSVLSNNTEERTRPFCERNGLNYFCKAKKPLPGRAKSAARALGLSREQVLVLGDQIFTDILCGRFAGMRTAAVRPIGCRATRWIAVKRILEKPIWRSYFRKIRSGGENL